MKKRYLLLALILIGLTAFALALAFHWELRDKVESIVYDFIYENNYVSTPKQIEQTLSQFQVVPLSQLPPKYLKQSKLGDKKYRPIVRKLQFFKILKRDVYQKIVGNNRIKSILTKDTRYRNSWFFSKDTLFLGIDKKVLFKVLELQAQLENKDYDKDAFFINSGHRTPAYNKAIGGASKSRHMKGQAIDMTIGDINKDGIYTKEDKKIVLDICDKKVIGNKGGIGLYPGTRAVHIDVRGYKARWNSY